MDEINNGVSMSDVEESTDYEDWSDVGASEETEPDTGEAAEPEQPAAEPEPEESAEQGEEGTDSTEPSDGEKEGNQLFRLKHLGEEREVGIDELTALAQKGLDYDHVRQERDDLKSKGTTPDDYDKLKAESGYLQEIAELTGSSVEDLILRTRASKLMRENEELSETDALLQAKNQIQFPESKKSSNGGELSEANLRTFIETYPDVKAESIPQEVWQDSFAHGGDLTGAYARWENKQLKTQIAQMKQSEQNKQRSTGSRKSAGTEGRSAVDDAWDAVLKEWG